MKPAVTVSAALSLLISFASAQQAPDSAKHVNDSGILLHVEAPHAREVLLHSGQVVRATGQTGDTLPFIRSATGTWELPLPPLPPNIYSYALRIDDAPALDVLNPRVQINAGAPMSELIVSDGKQYFDVQNVPHGAVVRHTYWSAQLGVSREVWVYSPPGYAGSSRSYPLLVLLGGNGQRAHSWVSTGRLPEIADNLLAAGQMVPMIIAMPDGHAEPVQISARGALAQTTTRADNAARFARDLVEDLMPFLENHYRVSPGRKNRAMAGLSMGAGLTDQVGLRHPEIFASFGLFSGGGGPGFMDRHAVLLGREPGAGPTIDLLFLGSGRGDLRPHGNLSALSSELGRRKIRHLFWDASPEGHNWLVWRPMLAHAFLPRLFSATPDNP